MAPQFPESQDVITASVETKLRLIQKLVRSYREPLVMGLMATVAKNDPHRAEELAEEAFSQITRLIM